MVDAAVYSEGRAMVSGCHLDEIVVVLTQIAASSRGRTRGKLLTRLLCRWRDFAHRTTDHDVCQSDANTITPLLLLPHDLYDR